jgi:hypothetical protein
VPSTLHTIQQRYTDKMSHGSASKNETGAIVVYEVQLWQMADARRDSIDAEKCKHVAAECKSSGQFNTPSRVVRGNAEHQNTPAGERSRRRPPVNHRVVETHADDRCFNGICP